MRELTVIGRLTRDPETRVAPSGTTVTTISLATNSKRGSVDVVDYTRCTAFNQQAGYISRYAHKGDEVFVRGTYSTHTWKDEQGNDRSREEMNVSEFRLLRQVAGSQATETVDTTDANPPA